MEHFPRQREMWVCFCFYFKFGEIMRWSFAVNMQDKDRKRNLNILSVFSDRKILKTSKPMWIMYWSNLFLFFFFNLNLGYFLIQFEFFFFGRVGLVFTLDYPRALTSPSGPYPSHQLHSRQKALSWQEKQSVKLYLFFFFKILFYQLLINRVLLRKKLLFNQLIFN